MKKLLFLVVLTAISSSIFAQERSAQSLRDHAYRTAITVPTYDLANVRGLIKRIKADSDNNQRLPEKKFDALTLKQKFTYTMLHGEDFMQNCDGMPAIVDESKKIFAFPPDTFDDETGWSEHQRAFLTNNRSKIIPLIRETMLAKNRAGTNLKHAILELNAYELIPDLIKVFNAGGKRDNDILTVLMLLMKEGQYKPFVFSASYTKLYADENESYKAFLVANPENKQLEVDRAMAYYKTKKS